MSDTIGTISGSEAASAAANSSGEDSSSSIGKCPVDQENRSLWGVLGNVGGGDGSNTSTSNGSGSDSDSSSSTKQQRNNNVAASLEEAAMYAQTPLENQRLPLSTHRFESSIPRGEKTGVNENDGDDKNNNSNNLPAHQIQISKLNGNDNGNGKENNTWVYPSEQQVFNAMQRKGWKGVEEESIPSFLQVHNSVNERSWKDVCKWEEPNKIELVRFEGRPKDLSPKAWFLSTFLFQDKPFDRHDWYVSNDTQEEKRYVLDFYMTDTTSRSDGMMMPRVEIDVRPALDNPEAFVQRGKHLLREIFPGISREIDERLSKE